jgi:DNA-binding LacI/PurR family transcriptional regulator
MPRPTIQDVARAAGVSPTTVSHAFSGRRHVDPETRKRIEAVAAQLGYRPNLRAQRLRTGRSGAIALVSSMPFSVAAGPSRLGFMMEIAAVAASAALSRDLALCLVPPLDGMERLDFLDVDGAIVIEPAAGDPFVAAFRQRGVAVVAIGRLPDEPALPFVDLQSRATAELLLDHLRDAGARQIALVTGAQRRNSYVEAEAAYADFAAANGLSPVAIRVDEQSGEEGARRACLELLGNHPGVDGLCVPVDAFAVGALAAATEAGRRVPEDLRLVTRYDGLRARLAVPPLTAVDLHLETVAEQAVELLFLHMANGDAIPAAMAPAPRLIVRRSSRRSPASEEA